MVPIQPSILPKLTFHFSNIFFAWIAWTPQKPPSPSEQNTFTEKPHTREYIPNFVSWFTPSFNVWVKLITVLELYLLFCNIYPNIIHQPTLYFLSVTPTTLTNLTNVPPTFVLGCTLLAAGASLRGLCYWYLGKNFTFQLALRKGHTLCTGGPYSIVRHPSYTGIVLCLLGHTLCMLGPGSWWAESHTHGTSLGKFVAVLWITMVCLLLGMAFTRVSKEDIIMKDAFGSQWVEWANRTPYAMIPLLY